MQALNASFHYDEEMFVQGRKIITEGILAVKASNKQGHFEAAKQKLGEIFHPLQVNFMITGSTVFNRQRRSDDKQQRSNITASGVQLYRDLAQASGGQAIEVSKSELPVATSIITESSSSSLVTLLQAARNPGKPNNFTFMVDETVIKLTVYITGRSLSFTLISPTGDTA